MRYAIEIEDIEEMRRAAGIDDAELRRDIRGLRVGDIVKLTFSAGPRAFESLFVRITSIRGSAFRGKLATDPVCGALSQLHNGSPVAFTSNHIHSLQRKEPPNES
jgi:hypothetical protein